MTTTRPGPRRLAVAAAVLASVAALTGCSVDRLGSAAVVEGEPISTDEVQARSREVLDVLPDVDASRVQDAVLQQMIVSRIFDEISTDLGVTVEPGTVSAELGQLVRQAGGRTELVQALASAQGQVVAPSQLERWQRDRLIFEAVARKLGGGSGEPDQDAFTAANDTLTTYARDLDVEVNPRYGRWDPQNGLAPQVGGGLSKTVDELAGER